MYAIEQVNDYTGERIVVKKFPESDEGRFKAIQHCLALGKDLELANKGIEGMIVHTLELWHKKRGRMPQLIISLHESAG